MRMVQAALAAAAVGALGAPGAQADERAAELLAQARAALGGSKLEQVTGVTASGEIRRVFGEREMSGDLTIDLAVPDRIRRTEEMGLPGGPSMTRVAVLNGGEYWEDATNRGGGMMRMGAGGPGGPGGMGREPTEEDRARFREMQQRRLAGERLRYQLIWLLRADAPVSYGGIAEAEDGRAEVLEVAVEGQEQPVRLFLDAETLRPLMLTYAGIRPRMRIMERPGRQGPAGQGTPGGSPPAGARPPWNDPPERVTFELRFDDYRNVDGVLLPHRFTQSVGGVANEEWTIGRYRVNPPFKKGTFEKK